MQQKDIDHVREYLLGLQSQITSALMAQDDKLELIEDNWDREQGGGGRSRVMKNGQLFEQAGINFSHVLIGVGTMVGQSFVWTKRTW